MPFLLIDFGTPLYDESIALRDLVLRQPLGLQFYTEDISTEYSSYHLGYLDEEYRLRGILVLLPVDRHTIKMRQVATHPDLQGQGIGTALVTESEIIARRLGKRSMVLHARQTAIAFYYRLDYQIVGESFIEVGIEHFKMMKKLV